jgi:hypothetical protein
VANVVCRPGPALTPVDGALGALAPARVYARLAKLRQGNVATVGWPPERVPAVASGALGAPVNLRVNVALETLEDVKTVDLEPAPANAPGDRAILDVLTSMKRTTLSIRLECCRILLTTMGMPAVYTRTLTLLTIQTGSRYTLAIRRALTSILG